MTTRELVSTRIRLGYVVLMLVLGVGVFTVPRWSAVNWAAIGLVSAAAVGYGARRHRPHRQTPWWWLAAAILAMATGDTVYGTSLGGADGPLAIVSELCYLAALPLVAAALIQLSRSSVVLRDRSRLLDLLTFTCGAACPTWVFLLDPGLDATALDGVEKSVLAVYLTGCVLVLVTVTRLVFAAPGNRSAVLLAVGAGGLLASDAAYALTELHGDTWRLGGASESGYVLLYLAWGAAALNPSMVRLTAPVDPGRTEPRGGWPALLGLSLAIPPATLAAQSLTGGVDDGVLIAVISLLMLLLVITRLADAITGQRDATTRERGLREVCGALVAATGPAEIGAAVHAAVGRLMPRGADHRVVLTVEEAPGRMPPDGSGTVRRTGIVPADELEPPLRERLGGFPVALVCPLEPDREPDRDRDPDRDTGATPIGALFVAADDRILEAVRDAVEILAAQATLALDRIALTDAANRRESDRYVRNVVQNTSDVVLIVDGDDRIRYASPSLAAILGMELPSFATLHGLVHPDDHRAVTRTLTQAPESQQSAGARDQWTLRRDDGGRALVEVTCRDLRRDRMVRGFVITMQDITDRHRHQQEMIRRALAGSPAGQNRKSALDKFRSS